MLNDLRNKSKGASITPYGLVVGLIAVVSIAALTQAGGSVNALFSQTSDTLEGAVAAGGGVGAGSSPAEASYEASCADILAAQPSTSSGLQTIDPDGPGGDAPISTYCDMDTDGGGWTRFYAFDQSASSKHPSSSNFPGYIFADNTDYCPDVSNECLYMLPSSASSSTEFLIHNTQASYSFTMDSQAVSYFKSGTIPTNSCGSNWTGCVLSGVTMHSGSSGSSQTDSAPVEITISPSSYDGFLFGGASSGFGSCYIFMGEPYVGCGSNGTNNTPNYIYYR